MNQVTIRKAKDSDLPFICDSMWRSSKGEKNMATVKQIVADSLDEILVACLEGDEDIIVGYVINKIGHENYLVYVKVAFRGLGIERMLA
jgi:hypothetical protein